LLREVIVWGFNMASSLSSLEGDRRP